MREASQSPATTFQPYISKPDLLRQLLNNSYAAALVFSLFGFLGGWIGGAIVSKILKIKKGEPPQGKPCESYYSGNFYQDRENDPKRNGWLVGRFMNEKVNDLRGTDKVEIKFWKFEKGVPTKHPSKYQRFATEYTFVLRGKIRGRIGLKELELEAGNYVVIPPNVISNLAIEVLSGEAAEGITIKAPSLPGDTVKLTD